MTHEHQADEPEKCVLCGLPHMAQEIEVMNQLFLVGGYCANTACPRHNLLTV